MRNIILGFILGLTLSLSAQEVVNLTTPVVVTKSTFGLKSIYLENLNTPTRQINVQWVGNDGSLNIALYPTTTPATLNPLGAPQPSGNALYNTLNTGNQSVNSMEKKLFQRLQTDGYIAAGSITGTPQ